VTNGLDYWRSLYDLFWCCACGDRVCEQAKVRWTQLSSRKEEGVDNYKIDVARDADVFPEPKWPTQSLDDLIGVTFAGRMIDREDHPGLLRLIGAKQIP
jgi:hypothetical protein